MRQTPSDPIMKIFLGLLLLLGGLTCRAEFLQFEVERGVKLQVGLEIKRESNLLVSHVRMGPTEVYVVKVSDCSKGAGQILVYDAAGKKLQDTFTWVKDGKGIGDIIGTTICKYAPK